jgi:thiamine-monophosphate kinase
MQIKELGEFDFIRRFAPFFANVPSHVEGIGDDCAIISQSANSSLLVTTDMLIENVHFITSKISPKDLGHKALAVNLSDIAAMGGIPLYAFLSLALPPHTEIDWADAFFEGLGQLAHQTNVSLLGGDTTASPSPIAINLTVIGKIDNKCIKRRSQALPNDIICCTGYLGDSGAGLKILLNQLTPTAFTQPLISAHCHPQPHLKEGQWLSQQECVHAMMDVSDGIDSDIGHIMEQSHCGAQIDLDALPLSPALIAAAKQWRWDASEIAATAGEDYCLLLTVDPLHYQQLANEYQQYFQCPLFKIGTITSDLKLHYRLRSQPTFLEKKGFNHF